MSIPETTTAWDVRGSGPLEPVHFCTLEAGPASPLIESVGCLDTYSRVAKDGVVPGSDGSSEVIPVGSGVSRFEKAHELVTAFYQHFFGGPAPTDGTLDGALGGWADGTFCEFRDFDEQGPLLMPRSLDFLEASTLPCAALTAWNGLDGLQILRPGDCVLTQGTSGISFFAMYFAIAAGVTVIATSSDAKAQKLKELGARHVINYRQEPNWGAKAKELSPQGLGCQRVIEIGGPSTTNQSLQVIAPGGHIAVIGFFFMRIEKGEDHPSFLEPFARTCVVRGIEVGNPAQFEEMIRAVDVNDIRPVPDFAVSPPQ